MSIYSTTGPLPTFESFVAARVSERFNEQSSALTLPASKLGDALRALDRIAVPGLETMFSDPDGTRLVSHYVDGSKVEVTTSKEGQKHGFKDEMVSAAEYNELGKSFGSMKLEVHAGNKEITDALVHLGAKILK